MLDLQFVICRYLILVCSRERRGFISDWVCEISFWENLISTLLSVCEIQYGNRADVVRRNLVADIVRRAGCLYLVACIWL